MSQDKPPPEPKDRTALYIAIVGATATVLAALVSVVPNLLNRTAPPAPTPIIIIAAPVPTRISEATTVPPTPALVPPSPTPKIERIDFLVTNNRPGPYDFFIDDEFQITVPAGGYQRLRVIPGEHKLTHCPRGKKPGDPDNRCETLARDVRNNPFDWQLGGSVPARDKVLLFLLNQIDYDVDIYIDGTAPVPVDAHQIGTVQLDPGAHRVQACHRGITPAQGTCGTVGEFEFLYNVEMYVVNLP